MSSLITRSLINESLFQGQSRGYHANSDANVATIATTVGLVLFLMGYICNDMSKDTAQSNSQVQLERENKGLRKEIEKLSEQIKCLKSTLEKREKTSKDKKKSYEDKIRSKNITIQSRDSVICNVRKENNDLLRRIECKTNENQEIGGSLRIREQTLEETKEELQKEKEKTEELQTQHDQDDQVIKNLKEEICCLKHDISLAQHPIIDPDLIPALIREIYRDVVIPDEKLANDDITELYSTSCNSDLWHVQSDLYISFEANISYVISGLYWQYEHSRRIVT